MAFCLFLGWLNSLPINQPLKVCLDDQINYTILCNFTKEFMNRKSIGWIPWGFHGETVGSKCWKFFDSLGASWNILYGSQRQNGQKLVLREENYKGFGIQESGVFGHWPDFVPERRSFPTNGKSFEYRLIFL